MGLISYKSSRLDGKLFFDTVPKTSLPLNLTRFVACSAIVFCHFSLTTKKGTHLHYPKGAGCAGGDQPVATLRCKKSLLGFNRALALLFSVWKHQVLQNGGT